MAAMKFPHQPGQMSTLFSRFLREDDGVTAIEMGLTLMIISLAILVGGSAAGDALSAFFNETASDLAEASPSGGEGGD